MKEIFRLIQKRSQMVFQRSLIIFTQKTSNLAYIQVCKICSTISLYFSSHRLGGGNATCNGRPGSFGYESKDTITYANWGVDYLKLDSCNLYKLTPIVEYAIIRNALNATGRPIFYSLSGIS